jgi:hypothetical protein
LFLDGVEIKPFAPDAVIEYEAIPQPLDEARALVEFEEVERSLILGG